MLRNKTLLFATLLVALFSCGSLIASTALGKKKIKVLIVDGQNNHENWPATTSIMKQYLEETELFEVTVSRMAFTWKGDDLIPKYPIAGLPATTPVEKPVTDPEFKPDFSNYDVVISNFGWNAASWPLETQQALEAFVAKVDWSWCMPPTIHSPNGWNTTK